MPRKKSEAVPEGNGPVPRQEKFGPDEPTRTDIHRMTKERFDQSDRHWDRMKSHFDKLERRLKTFVVEMRAPEQRLVSLEQDARQPRLATEAGGPADEKTRGRTEGAATAVQAMRGDSCSVNRVDPDPRYVLPA